jgi:hypothetical protein
VFVASTAVFGILLTLTVWRIVAANGDLVYAIDDPYIHLALARTLAEHGTWGLTPGVYESASSAPLWTLVLAGALEVPLVPASWWPLIANVAAGLWLLWIVSGLGAVGRLRRAGAWRLAILVVPISLGMVTLAVLGMEHLLHAAIVAEVLVLLTAVLAGRGGARTAAPLLGLLAIGSLVRFETAFVGIGVAVAILVCRDVPAGAGSSARLRQPATWGLALGSLAAVAAAVGAHAAWNVGHGQFPVPNSVAAKSSFGDGPLLDLARATAQATEDPAFDLVLVAGLAALVVVGWRRPARRAAGPLLAAVIVGLALLTGATVSSQSLDRYQSFAVVALVVGLLLLATDLRPGTVPRWVPGRGRPEARTIATAALLLTLAGLRLPVLGLVVPSSEGIERQQHQMGRFLAEHYAGRGVLVNDLGWVAYLHDGPVLDVAGLGSHPIVRAQKDGRLDRAVVEAEAAAQGTEVAVVFDRWFADAVPGGWVRVGQWCLDGEAVTNGDRCVSWYAPPEGATELRRNLESFTPSLPDGVTVQLTDGG